MARYIVLTLLMSSVNNNKFVCAINEHEDQVTQNRREHVWNRFLLVFLAAGGSELAYDAVYTDIAMLSFDVTAH
jgi:hypothetical protein